MSLKKLGKRGAFAALSVGKSLLPPVLNFGMAYLVIHGYSKALWGEFVNFQLFITLAVTFLSWNSKEYLLRSFSKDPANLTAKFQSVFITRLPLFIVPSVIAITLFPLEVCGWLILWMVGQFLSQSVEVLVDYHRKYAWAILGEVVAILTALGLLWLKFEELTAVDILLAFTVAACAKGIILSLIFSSKFFGKWTGTWEFSFFKAALPFFLIGLSGLFQSKTDLYVVNFFLEDDAVGTYQVVINAFLYLQAIAGLALVPFAKNFIRLPVQSVAKGVVKYSLLGFLMLIPGCGMAYLLLNGIYDFELGWYWFLYGGLFVLPTFAYLPIIYLLYGQKKEHWVLWLNFGGAGLNLILTTLLIQTHSILGALIGSVIAQWIMLVCYLRLLSLHKNDPLSPENPAD